MYHILFICFSVDEHVSCLTYVLTIVNSAAVNIRVKVYF